MNARESFGDTRKSYFHTLRTMFPDYFKTKRKALPGLTHDAIAKALGTSRVAVSNWESGKNLPDPKKIPALADLLHVPVGDLMREAYPDLGMDYHASATAAHVCTLPDVLASIELMTPMEIEHLRIELDRKARLAALYPPPSGPKAKRRA